MTPVFTVDEFVKENDEDITKILKHMAWGASKEDLEELQQEYYFNIIHNDTLAKFDRNVKNVPAHFARYIWTSCRFTVFKYVNNPIMAGDSRWISQATDIETQETVDLIDYMSYQACNYTHHTMSLNLIGKEENETFDEEKFNEMLEAFESEIGADPDLTENTKARCLRYLVASRSGVLPAEFAEDEGVAPTYISRLKRQLAVKFRLFRESYDGGLSHAT